MVAIEHLVAKRAGRPPRHRRGQFRVDLDTGLPCISSERLTLHDSSLALVEDAAVSAHGPPPTGLETKPQIIFTYLGLFSYGVGSTSWLADQNSVLFVAPDREFADTHPVAGLGHASLIVNPSPDLFAEMCGRARITDYDVSLRESSARVRLLAHRFLALDHDDPLYCDELTVAFLDEVMAGKSIGGPRSPVVNRAKELIHAHGADRLSLGEIAASVGVSGPYLTQKFSEAEGMPLYRYQLRLRLSRALLELPHSDDITALALELGFSSHSHFTSTFKTYFGMTPSAYRMASRRRVLEVLSHAGRHPFGLPANSNRPFLSAAF